MRSKIRSPIATLTRDQEKICLKNISWYQIIELHNDLQISLFQSLKRFANANQEANHYFIKMMYLSVSRKIINEKPYYSIFLPTAGMRSFVSYFSKANVSYSTIEIIALIDPKLPILC